MNAVPFRRIGFDTARDLMGKADLLLLDVRDAASFARGHIARAENASPINLGRLLSETPKDKLVLIYCYHGNSSQAYAKAFAESGFCEVYSLDGGYEGWATAQARITATAPSLSDTLRGFLVAQSFPPDDVNAVGKNQMTPLMQAAHLGPPALVAELLAAGARVDAMNSDGSQPLWLACVGNDPEIVTLLIRAGADLEHKNVNGSTALMYAASASKAKALTVLLEAGADLTYENDGFSALDMAASRECLDLLRAAQRRTKVSS